MKDTKIQWCDDSVNPVMGCDGCELWPTIPQIRKAVDQSVRQLLPDIGSTNIAAALDRHLTARLLPSEAYKERTTIVRTILQDLLNGVAKNRVRRDIERAITSNYHCYAGIQTNMRGGHNAGYPEMFERPELFPGRMAEAASARDLTDTARVAKVVKDKVRPAKPWLDGMPRLIFVSDMGDALSSCIPFDYLKREIIDVVSSPKGTRHIWLWVTKRPARMAEFASWLEEHGAYWPGNLVPMTSVTNQATAGRIGQLRKMPSRLRGLSVEPLLEPVSLDLRGIHWVVLGGESGSYARPFDLAWARDLRDQCRRARVPFFMKQLGARPIDQGMPLKLKDRHGGDWAEWPDDLRIRELPAGFSRATLALQQAKDERAAA